MTDERVRRQIRAARSKFAAMAATYGLGVFNDSFFRQSAMLLAVAGGAKDKQGYVMSVFALPYLLFASPAGWLADRFSKRNVVIAAKLLELAAMLCGAAGMCTGHWGLILAMVFLMALQSCIFSPALNGSIPELYPPEHVIRANATLKVVVIAMILGGITASGLALGAPGEALGVSMGRWVVAAGAVGIAALGVLASLGVARRPATAPGRAFPWTGPLDTLRQFALIRRDGLLLLVVVANVTAWFAGSLLVQFINLLATHQLGTARDVDTASYMVAVELIGVAAGGLAGGRLARGRRWYRALPGGLFALAGMLGAMGLLPMLGPAAQRPAAFALLGLIGLLGGMVLIPSEGLIQVRAAGDRKGIVIASVNFAVFAGILLSGPIANVLNRFVRPSTGIAVIGAMVLPAGAWLWRALAKGVQE